MRNISREIDRLSDKELLQIRFCDLPIRLRGTPVEQRAHQVFAELASRHIKVKPSIWLSEEWFNPDGTVGFAIPFYLAHPRLVRLERRLMLEAEGASEREALRIIRHETGHAIDEAFQFYRRPEYAAVFGSPQPAIPVLICREAVQPSVCCSSQRLVRAGAPRRGFRRDLCHLAASEAAVEAPVSRLAGHREIRSRRCMASRMVRQATID